MKEFTDVAGKPLLANERMRHEYWFSFVFVVDANLLT